MKYKETVAFNCAAITESEYDYLVEIVRLNNFHKILELGPGASSFAFLENDCDIYSFDHHPKWHQIEKEKFADYENIKNYLYNNQVNMDLKEIEGMHFDLALVDSPPSGSHPTRKDMCEYVSDKTDVILLHDAKRPFEQEIYKCFSDKKEWNAKYINTTRGFALFYKNDIILPVGTIK